MIIEVKMVLNRNRINELCKGVKGITTTYKDCQLFPQEGITIGLKQEFFGDISSKDSIYSPEYMYLKL